jgi:hypothetical protein
MRSRRFALLAAVLVTLNVALWIVPQGLALQQVVIANLFGKNMVRADVVVAKGCPSACTEWRLDRGNVVSNSLGVLTLREADGRLQPINVSSSTRVTNASNVSGPPVGAKGIKPGWRVLVTWPAPNGTAQSVLIERR